ncbi:hypothetical protein DJ568_13790 [Mucilaginibacter hurinus]|uniref:DUF4185 domain-containing protein n=1 Tax=Mucilaginibacter hurinus TaxID=2201324 RepID=A0A367GMU8_9SPHI|nr:DUF4185 domain-containing protein [Mucilaginibacter hurinus]RCH54355.1 hypothetical protein DJ568_13790 [Mucilaginibacter hurinus]
MPSYKSILKPAIFAFAALCAFSSCKKNGRTDIKLVDTTKPVDTIAPVDTPYVFACAPATFAGIATKYNDYFTRGNTTEDQWTGADATYSVPLGDGKILWAFGDTFVGKVNPPDAKHKYRWRSGGRLISNTFMIQNTNVTPNTFITVVGAGDAPGGGHWPVVKTGKEYDGANKNEWYWPSDGTVIGDKLYMFFTRYKHHNNSYYSTGSDVFTFSVAELKALTATVSTINSTKVIYYNMPSNQYDETHFGAAILEDGVKDHYVYIADKVDFYPFGKWHCSKVLKVDQNNFTGKGKYFAGYGPAPAYEPQWTDNFTGSASTSGNMKRLENGKLVDLLVMNEFAVIKTKNKYRLITQREGDSKHIDSYESTSPVGPWDCRTLIHTITEVATEPVSTYNGFLHPQIKNGDNQYLFGYNLNAKNFSDVFNRVDTYRPKFIWVTIPD